MRRKTIIVLLAILVSAPMLTWAQNVVYVNTDAPGVHKVYDKKYGGYVWKDGMGGFLCRDKEMKPISEMDKHVYFTGTNNDPDNPQVSPYSGVKKEWDKKRGCYVWKSSTGDFLGTDKASVKEQELKKQKELAKQKEKEEKVAKQQQKEKEKAEKKQQKTETPDEAIQRSDKMLITTDEEMRQAEEALREVKAQMAEAKAEGIDLSEYGIEGYIKEIEDAINEYKRVRGK